MSATRKPHHGDSEPAGAPLRPGGRSHRAAPPRGVGLAVRFARLSGLTSRGVLSDPFYFQVAPTDAFRRTGSAPWTPISTVGFGQVSQPGTGPDSEQFAFSSVFVDYDPSWAAYHYGTDPYRAGPRRGPGLVGRPSGRERRMAYVPPNSDAGAMRYRAPAAPVDPMGWLRELRELRDSLTPFSLLVGMPAAWGSWYVKNKPVYITDLNEEIPTGEDDALHFDVSLTEYRGAHINRETRAKTPAVVEVDDDGVARWSDGDGHHHVKHATLHDLAEKFYGDPSLWRMISLYEKNPHLRGFGAGHRTLADYAKRYGHGKKSKVAKIHVPALADFTSDDAHGVVMAV